MSEYDEIFKSYTPTGNDDIDAAKTENKMLDEETMKLCADKIEDRFKTYYNNAAAMWLGGLDEL